MGYTCYSEEHGGCGALHRTKALATSCCKVHAGRHDEVRVPAKCATLEELEDKFPPSEAAQTRRSEYLATRTDTRKKYDPGAAAEAAGAGDGGGAAEPVAAAPSPSDASPEPMEPEDGEGQQAPPQSQEQQPPPPPPEDDPLKPLVDAITPRVAENLRPELVEGTLKAVRSEMKKAAEQFKGAVPDDIAKTRKEAKEASQIIRDLAKGAKEAADDAEETISRTLKKLDDIEKRVAETRKVEIVVTHADGSKTCGSGSQHKDFEKLLRLVAAGENVFMSGPAGSGKTTAAQKVADAMGMKLIIQPVATDKFDAVGFIDAAGTYRPSAVYRWAKSPEPAILLIDEIDAWIPAALVALNPVLDNRIGIFPEGQFDIDPRHRVVATANTWGLGANAEYCGRNRLDAASLDRFGARLEWDYDEGFERKLVYEMVGQPLGKPVADVSAKARKELRKNGVRVVWGPRQTFGLARRIAAGFSLDDAFAVSAMASVPDGKRKAVMGAITLGPIKVAIEKARKDAEKAEKAEKAKAKPVAATILPA